MLYSAHLDFLKSVSLTLQAVERMEYVRGRTNTAEALRLLYTEMFTPFNGDRVDVPNYAIVITDGESNINSENTLPEAIAAR